MKIRKYTYTKQPLIKKNIRILLFILSGVLAIAAVVVYIVLWNEGTAAEQKAQALLAASNIGTSAEPLPLASGTDNYVQPDARGNGIGGIFRYCAAGYR